MLVEGDDGAAALYVGASFYSIAFFDGAMTVVSLSFHLFFYLVLILLSRSMDFGEANIIALGSRSRFQSRLAFASHLSPVEALAIFFHCFHL